MVRELSDDGRENLNGGAIKIGDSTSEQVVLLAHCFNQRQNFASGPDRKSVV